MRDDALSTYGAAAEAAASAAQGQATLGDVFGAGVSAQALLTAPPLVAITLDITRLKRAGAMLPITPVEHQAFDCLMDDLSGLVSTINCSVGEINRDLRAEALELGPIKDELQAIRRITQALNRPPYTQERSRITAIISVIESSFMLLEKEINHRIAMPNPAQRAQVQWQTHGFHAEQSLIEDSDAEKTALDKLLEDLSSVFTFDHKPPQCFISYAWPTPENQLQEYWVQPFLKRIRAQLRLAGIQALLDIEDNTTSRNIRRFAAQISESDYALCFCTESLKDKDRSPNYRVIQRELNLLKQKHESDVATLGQTQVLYLLGSGDHDTGYPEELREYRTVYDWRDKGYVKGLETLLRNLYGFRYPRESTDHQSQWAQFDALWTAFYQAFPDQKQGLTPAAIQTALAKPVPRPTDYSALLSAFRDLSEEQDPILFAPLFRLPQRLPHFTGRLSVLRTIATQLESDQVGVVTSGGFVQQSVSGLGGVGKTSLLLEYAHRARAREVLGEGTDAITPTAYDHIIWLSGKEPLSAFKALAQERLGLDSSIDDKVPLLMRKIYETLMARYPKVLLILDDVPNEDAIQEFLPSDTLDAGDRLHVLMSSRSANWECASIALDSFTPEEARAYILDLLPSETKEAADALAERLYYFPLALSQAVAYIQKTHCEVRGYLSRYETKTAQLKLLQSPALRNSQTLFTDDRQKAVYTTWHISIESLKEKQPQAARILNLSAYYAPKEIPTQIFHSGLSLDPTDLDDALSALESYSLIQIGAGQTSFSVHQLLQEIIRSHHREASASQKHSSSGVSMGGAAGAVVAADTRAFQISSVAGYIAESLDLLDHAFIYDKSGTGFSEDMHEWKKDSILLPHIDMIVNHTKSEKIIELQVGRLANNAAALYQKLGDYKSSRSLLEYALKIFEGYYDKSPIELANTQVTLAVALRSLGDAPGSIELLEQALKVQVKFYPKALLVIAKTFIQLALSYEVSGSAEHARRILTHTQEIQEQYYSKNHIEMVPTLVNLARLTPEIDRKIALLLEARKIEEDHYPKDHVELATTLVNLAIAYGQHGRKQDSIELLVRSNSIQQEYYGEHHIVLAPTLIHLSEAIQKRNEKVTLLNQVLKIQQNEYGNNHAEVAITHFKLADISFQLGNKKQAKIHADQAFAIFKSFDLVDADQQYIRDIEIFIRLISLLDEYDLSDSAQKNLETALLRAVEEKKDLETIKILIKYLENINTQHTNPFIQKTALHYAVINKNAQIIKWLLDAGALTDIEDADKKTAVDVLHELNDPASCHIFTKYYEEKLFYASASGEIDTARAYLTKDVNVNALFREKYSALFAAVYNKHSEIIPLLLEHHADPKQSNEDGMTPFALALELKDQDSIDRFFQYQSTTADIPDKADCDRIIKDELKEETIEDALKYNQIFLTLSPDSIRYNHSIACLHHINGDLDMAKKNFEKTLALKRTASALVDYAIFLMHYNDKLNDLLIRDTPLSCLKEARRIDDNSMLVYRKMDESILDLDFSSEIEHRGEAIKLSSWQMATWLLIHLYIQEKKDEDSIELLQELNDYTAKNKEDSISLILLTHAACKLEKYDLAKELLLKLDNPSDVLLDKIPDSRKILEEKDFSSASGVALIKAITSGGFGLFNKRAPEMPLSKLLQQQTIKNLQAGLLKIIFKTEVEAKHCQNLLGREYPADKYPIMTEISNSHSNMGGAAGAAAPVENTYSIILSEVKFNQIISDDKLQSPYNPA